MIRRGLKFSALALAVLMATPAAAIVQVGFYWGDVDFTDSSELPTGGDLVDRFYVVKNGDFDDANPCQPAVAGTDRVLCGWNGSAWQTIGDGRGAAGGGEANTGANLGGGLDNFDSKSGVTLRFNSFDATDFALAGNVISLAAGGTGDITAVGDCLTGDAFTGTCGSFLTFDDALGDLTMAWDGAELSLKDGQLRLFDSVPAFEFTDSDTPDQDVNARLEASCVIPTSTDEHCDTQLEAMTNGVLRSILFFDSVAESIAFGHVSNVGNFIFNAINTGDTVVQMPANSIGDGEVVNTITLDNLTQITTRNHSDLQGIGANDHHTPTVDTGPVPDCVTATDVQTGDGSCVDPATQSELDTHEGNANAHHSQTHNLLSSDHPDTVVGAPANGDLIAAGLSGWEKLAVGASNTFLRSDGSNPGWLAITLGTHTAGNYVASITNGSGITGGDGGSEGANLTLAATLGDSVDLTSEVTGILPRANGGTGVTTGYARPPRECLTIADPDDAQDFYFFKALDGAMTVGGVGCISDDGTSVVLTANECDANGGSCTAIEAAITCGLTWTTEAGGVDNPSIDAEDIVRIDVGTVTGSTQVMMCLDFS